MRRKRENIVGRLEKHPVVYDVLDGIRGGQDRISVLGSRGSLTGMISALSHLACSGKPTLLLARDPQSARDLFADVVFTLDQHNRNGIEEVFLFEDLNLLAQDFLTLTELETIFYRYRVLENLITGAPVMVVTSRQALGVPLVAPSRYREHMIMVREGDRIEKNQFLRDLFDIGYRLVSRVREVGQVAGRGGIVDVFPPGRKRPVRIDLFGDEVESIREFDPESQRSLAVAESLTISPCFEAELLRDQDPEALFDVEGELRESGKIIEEPVRFREFSPDEKDEFLARGYSYFDKAGIWDYLPEGSLVIVDAPGLTLSRDVAMELPKAQAGDGVRLPEHSGLVHGVDDIARGLSIFPRLEFLSATCPLPAIESQVRDLNAQFVKLVPGSFDRRLEQYLDRHGETKDGSQARSLIIVSRSSERIREILAGLWPNVTVLHGDLSEGFDLSPFGPVVLTDSELFPTRKRGLVQARGKVRAFTREELRDVRVGDYLVHVHFGIGVFRGIVQQARPDGSVRDYILMEYAQNDRLYVPV
jgi:transcription-repair coupling factor (superfamily II helicase)